MTRPPIYFRSELSAYSTAGLLFMHAVVVLAFGGAIGAGLAGYLEWFR